MKKVYKLGLSLGATLSVVAPISTAVACGADGGKSKVIFDTAKAPKTSVALKDVALSEYDVERSVLNTEAYGLLPLTRIQHTLESKDFGKNDQGLTYNVDLTNIGRSTTEVMDTTLTLVKDIDLNDADLKEQSKIYIDQTVQVNGQAQSLSNPIKSYTITKKDILSDPTAYEKVAKSVSDFLTQNKNKKYSVLTIDPTEDVADVKGEFNTGTYKINIYQKPSNSSDLDRIIAILKDPSKFGSDEFALEMMDGFSLGTVRPYSGDWNYSLFSNYLTPEGTKLNDGNLYKSGTRPQIFKANDLVETEFKSNYIDHFVSTESASGSSTVQFGSIALSSADYDLILNHSVQVANLVVDKKNNNIALELTVTATPNAKITTHNSANNGVPFTSDVIAKNYEQSSVETIYINLPKQTSWIKESSSAIMDELFKNVNEKINTPTIYESFINLFTKAQGEFLGFKPLEVESLVGPHLKSILIDNASWFEEAAKYSNLLKDKVFFANFVNWAEKTNNAFSGATLNLVLDNFPGIPDNLSKDLNSSKLYTYLGYLQIFYRQLSMYLESAEGQQYRSQLNTTTAQEQLEKELVKSFNDEVRGLKNQFDGKSFDSNKTLPDDKNAMAKIIALPTLSQNVKSEITDIVLDKANNSAKVEITFSPLKSKTAKLEKAQVTLTNLISDSEINVIKSNLANSIPSITGNYKIADQIIEDILGDGSMMSVTNSTLDKVTFTFRNEGNILLDDPLPKLVNDVQLTQEYLNAIIGQTEFDKLGLTTKTPTGTEFMFKAQNVDVANGTFDLVVGLRDVATKVTAYGSDTLKISK